MPKLRTTGLKDTGDSELTCSSVNVVRPCSLKNDIPYGVINDLRLVSSAARSSVMSSSGVASSTSLGKQLAKRSICSRMLRPFRCTFTRAGNPARGPRGTVDVDRGRYLFAFRHSRFGRERSAS
eukprot:1012780-Prorocentrum_minimum.AAC.2